MRLRVTVVGSSSGQCLKLLSKLIQRAQLRSVSSLLFTGKHCSVEKSHLISRFAGSMSTCSASGVCNENSTGQRFGEDILFGNLQIGASNILLSSPSLLTVALLHLCPITQGHSVIIPRRQVARLHDLTDEEANDFWRTVQSAQSSLQRHHGASAFNIAVLDGAGVGQPIQHTHAHLVPRFAGDDLGEDRIHSAIEAWSPVPRTAPIPKFDAPDDADRKPRNAAAMSAEAAKYWVRDSGTDIGESPYKFSKFDIAASSVFHRSATGLTIAFVNLKPLVPGHVLVTPVRIVAHFVELTDAEREDLFKTVRLVQSIVCKEHNAESANIGIQDGKDAGQSVAHLHVHILPRRSAEATL